MYFHIPRYGWTCPLNSRLASTHPSHFQHWTSLSGRDEPIYSISLMGSKYCTELPGSWTPTQRCAAEGLCCNTNMRLEGKGKGCKLGKAGLQKLVCSNYCHQDDRLRAGLIPPVTLKSNQTNQNKNKIKIPVLYECANAHNVIARKTDRGPHSPFTLM